MHLLNKEHRALHILIIIVALFRLLVSPNMGLGVDEAHYLLYALNLDWSYFDHPPLVGWTHFFFTSIFGMNEFGARISAIIIGALTSIFLYKLLYSIEQSVRLAFLGVLALHGVFLFNALFLMLMPETLLFLLILPIIFSVIELEKNPNEKNYLLLGVLLGLAGLSKYTAILFVPPIILYFLIKKRYEIFFSINILITFLSAFVLILPVLLWNSVNDWISFSYQSAHVVANESISLKGFVISLGTQFLAYHPLLMPLAFYGLYRAFISKNDTLFLVSLFGGVLFAFFTYSALYKTALPHWSALFYLLFIPLGVYYLVDRSLFWKKYLKIAVLSGLILSALIYIEVATKIIPLPDTQSLHVDMYGFDTIIHRANAQVRDSNKEAIAVTHWTLAARAIFANREYETEVYLLDKRFDQFDIWQKEIPLGIDLIVIDLPFAHQELRKYIKCDTLPLLDTFNILENVYKEKNIKLYRCTNYQGLQ